MAEQTLGKFRPKLHAKTTKMTPVSSSISDSTQPIQLKDSYPDPKHQEHSSVPPLRIADSYTIASDNNVTLRICESIKDHEFRRFDIKR